MRATLLNLKVAATLKAIYILLPSSHQVCVRKKEDGCHPPMLNSKLRSDSEGRSSVFSRLVETHKLDNKGKGSKTEAFPPRSARSFDPLSQRGKKWKAQRSKSFPRRYDGMLGMPSGDRLNRAPASNRSFVCRRSTKYSGEEAQSHLFVRMERNGMHLTNNLSDTTIAEGHLFLKFD
jgi:hypothetical protein